jgi:peptidoglycan/xylan/chitin deacetylase (PgdA/CDA1 family)
MESARLTSLTRRLSGAVVAGIRFRRDRYRLIGHEQQQGAIILMYHSVAGPDVGRWIDPNNRMDTAVFQRQMQFLAKNRRVMSLSELVSTLEAGERPKAGTVVITFDDGYVDNLRVAFPILNKLGLPATLFLPTAYVDDARPMWIDELYSLFQVRSRHVLVYTRAHGEARFRLDRERERRDAYAMLSAQMFNATYGERAQLLGMLKQQLKPTACYPRIMVTWREIARVRERFPLIEVGSHSVTHLDLARQPDVVVKNEVVASKRAIEEQLNSTVRFFAYPYNSVSEAASKYLPVAGYKGAVASGDELVGPGSPVSQLPRRAAPSGGLAFGSAV